jgi:hypothetical protein
MVSAVDGVSLFDLNTATLIVVLRFFGVLVSVLKTLVQRTRIRGCFLGSRPLGGVLMAPHISSLGLGSSMHELPLAPLLCRLLMWTPPSRSDPGMGHAVCFFSKDFY